MRLITIYLALGLSVPAHADTVFAANTIRPQSVLTAQDLVTKNIDIPGAAQHADQVIGQEARVALYAGRPIRLGDVGPPAVVDRNQIVPLIFTSNGLTITAEGRSLERAGSGEFIRVMNLASRATIMGVVMADGSVMVSR